MKESTLCRAYTVRGRAPSDSMTIREAIQPNTIVVEFCANSSTEVVLLSREDWYALMRVTQEYGSDFTWQPEPAPSNLKPEPTID